MDNFPKSFNGDLILQRTFADLFYKVKPDIVVETGTHEGYTTEYLCNFCVPVISTEIDPVRYKIASNRLLKNNLTLLLGDSAESLRENIGLLKDRKVLAFLDSHCFDDKVLERELVLFRELDKKPVIVIHDFYVPGKDFGYDSWDGYRYDYDNLKPIFDGLYGVNKYDFSYNTEAVGCKRGVIILEPCSNL